MATAVNHSDGAGAIDNSMSAAVNAEIHRTADRPAQAAPTCFALLGNPNTGKTTLYNRLCGLRAKTANFPGSTVEARIGQHTHGTHRYQIVDLPGVYGLNLDRPESVVARDYLTGRVHLGRDQIGRAHV